MDLFVRARAVAQFGPLWRNWSQPIEDNGRLVENMATREGTLRRTMLAHASFAAIVGLLVCAVTPAAAQELREALAQAYNTNPGLLAERSRLRATDEGVPTALSGWRPTVTVNGDVGASRVTSEPQSGGNSTTSSLTPSTIGLQVTQPIYRGGATVAGVRQAEALVEAGRAGLLSVEQDVLGNAAVAYLDVVRDQSVVELNVNNEQVLERQLEAARDRFEVGEVTRTDVSQAEARLSDAQASRVEAEGQLETARATYVAVIGAPPGTLSFSPPEDRAVLPTSRDETLSLALERNPDLSRAMFQEQAALHEISGAGARLLPQVSLNGRLQRAWEPNTFFSRQDQASITADVTVPLYQSGEEYARVRQLRQTAAQRRNELDQINRTVRENAESAWEQLVAARARIRAFEASEEANRIALEGVEQEAAVGARTVLDVLDAEQELFNARVNLVRARRDELVASVRVLQVVGGMTAERLNLPVTLYDPMSHYSEVRDKWIGFGDDYDGGAIFDFGWD